MKENINCGSCKYQRINRRSDTWLRGFCKCTGADINLENSKTCAPDWCPLRADDAVVKTNVEV